MSETKKLICIACPIGCRLNAEIEGNENITVTGNKCSRGEAYGKEEVVAPKRIVTAVVRSDSEKYPYIPVKITSAIPKENIEELLNTIYSMKALLPVKSGEPLIKNYKGLGIDVVFTRSAF